MIYRIKLMNRGKVINFVDDDDGDRLDQIEDAVARVLNLKKKESAGSPLEEVRVLEGEMGQISLYWDGYMTNLTSPLGLDLTVVASLLLESGEFASRWRRTPSP